MRPASAPDTKRASTSLAEKYPGCRRKSKLRIDDRCGAHAASAAVRPVIGLGTIAVLAAILGVLGCSRDRSATPPISATAGAEAAVQVPSPSRSGDQGVRCIAVATASVEEGPAPLRVVFSAEGLCTDGTATFRWDLDDGSDAVEAQTVEHVYTDPGTYVARLTIVDGGRRVEDSDEALVTVSAK